MLETVLMSPRIVNGIGQASDATPKKSRGAKK